MALNNFLKLAKQILRIVVPVAIGIFLLWQIYANWQEVSYQLRDSYPIFLILAFFANLTLYPLWLAGWYMILKALGQKVSFFEAFRIGVIANFAKYLPGVVWQYLGRIELAKTAGIPRPVGLASLAYEITIYLIGGGIWALLVFGKLFALLGLLGAAAAWFGLPHIFKLLRNRFARFKELPDTKIPLKTTLAVLIVNLLDFFVTGIALYLILAAFGPPALDPIKLTAIYAFSWIIGYLTFIAPGGLGVADATLAGLLAPHLGIGFASLVAILLRLIILGNELLLGTLVWKSWRSSKS